MLLLYQGVDGIFALELSILFLFSNQSELLAVQRCTLDVYLIDNLLQFFKRVHLGIVSLAVFHLLARQQIDTDADCHGAHAVDQVLVLFVK